MFMEAKRKFSWVFRYYDFLAGEVTYRTFYDLTIDDANFLANEFVKENSNYCLAIFKLYMNF